MSKEIIFSGIQPTGPLHLGNFLGAVKNWLDLQDKDKYQCIFSIVDLHSLTGNLGPLERRKQTLRLAAELLALGLDPKKSIFFVQSAVPEHTELAWIFSTVTPVAELQRMTQFKDKSAAQNKNINAGLLTYPILQAADILLYQATRVPVGRDQVQHIELTRDIARGFNRRYKKYFVETKPLLTDSPRVMSLLAPEKKMSKSLGEGHVINLDDDSQVVAGKIKKAVTDSGAALAPGVANLMLLLKNFADKATYEQFVRAGYAGTIRYGDLKAIVAENISLRFSDFREKKKDWLADEKKLKAILDEGAQKARVRAKETMAEVREIVGLL